MTKRLEIGVHLMTYGATWDEVVALAKEVDRLGYDFLLMHDHLLATQGDLHQPFFEAYTTLASFAHVTTKVKLGLMTGNNPLRNPGVVSKMVITLDHMSNGRMTLCLGAGSLPVEFPPHGLGTESVGQRLDAVDDALTILRGLLAGEEVTLKSAHYDFDRVRHAPRPVQDRVPVIVGASGEKKGLRIVAKHADYWQMSIGPESADEYRHKNEVLVQHCESIGRDPGTIRRMPSGNFILRKHESEVAPALADMAKPFRWSPEVHAEMASTTWGGPAEHVVEQLQPLKATGLDGLVIMALPPFDYESLERFAREVRPALEA
jgi:alkanesulfonate monooxygenase SsuD/methylene tetrahydromethanopterin reductase-like flavin-dependent oxidoreductase (luciferase family)